MTPPIWQLIRDAAQQLGGEMSYPQIKQRIWVDHPDINSTSLTCQIIACSVNHASRVHYSENKSPRLSSGPYDFLFNTGRGKVTIYDSAKHGQWEIAQTEDGLKVQLLEEAAMKLIKVTVFRRSVHARLPQGHDNSFPPWIRNFVPSGNRRHQSTKKRLQGYCDSASNYAKYRPL